MHAFLEVLAISPHSQSQSIILPEHYIRLPVPSYLPDEIYKNKSDEELIICSRMINELPAPLLEHLVYIAKSTPAKTFPPYLPHSD